MKAYDGVFIMNYILSNLTPKDRQPVVINNGSKIMSIIFNSVKVIDSYSFIPIGLAEFPKAFGNKELKKGFFPHYFNTDENQNYVGPYPPKETYGYRFFSTKKLQEFEEWYSKVSINLFDLRKEFLDYCWSDVHLLAEGCLEFRKIIIEMTRQGDKYIDPFQEAITIASLCHVIYRSLVLEPKTLAYIPDVIKEKNSSHKARIWLDSISNIQHANNGGEHKIGSYFVDGYNRFTDTVYEFHGCYFHGCPKCFNPETYNKVLKITMGTVYKRHEKRIYFIKSKCRELIEIWECEFDILEFKNRNIEFTEPLNPRDALFGGRTNALKLYFKCDGDQKIYYSDFTSLYPYVQKTCKYPIRHPIQITDNFESIENYFGVAKIKILPPRKLYLPVLPVKHQKLVFSLCRICPIENKNICDHTDEERCITGTWCTPEILCAVKEGYKIIKIYEVWHFPETSQYDKETKSGGIFSKYINLFLKGKQESSGYPSSVVTEQDKLDYQKNYFENEGILLDLDRIEKNPGKRFVFKLALNSMWGRLGMNCDRNQYKIINNTHDWLEMISNNQYVINAVDMKNENVIQVFYKDFYNTGSRETSVIHAAFVTCYARLKLYEELKQIGERVLYFDTDSIIYVAKEDDYRPKLGDYLGELTNEIDETDGNFIDEFVSAGPKNYAYKTDIGITKCTVKGFALNHLTKLKLNFDTIKELVTEDQQKKIEIEQLKFRRDKHDWSIKTEVINQQYGFVYDKRVLFEDLTTLHYGF